MKPVRYPGRKDVQESQTSRISALEQQCRELREALALMHSAFDDGTWKGAIRLKVKASRAILAKYGKP